ncbi:MAG: SMP-30/gluconolactonase/LRE family protein [Planctomycetota bacterium]
MSARCVWPAEAVLGEGPLWSAEERAVYFVDIKSSRVLRHRVGHDGGEVFEMPQQTCALGLCSDGRLIAAIRTGFAFLDLETKTFEPIATPEPDRPGNRFNDGKVDATGCFWAGTMDDSHEKPTGCLYRLGRDLNWERKDDGHVITNGPAWSPDGSVMYHNDSVNRHILAYDCDLESGAISNRRVFAEIPEGGGFPDGLTVDGDGHVWCALFGGSKVVRFTPGGEVVREIALPVSNVTSCTFGGEDLGTLFITTARGQLTGEQRAAQPLAGGLFAIEPGVRGLPTPKFAPLGGH